MQEKKCARCGNLVVIADRGESIAEGETPREHMERTGHIHINKPTPMSCADCGNVWMYGGAAELPTCPNCKGKRTEAV